MVRRERTPDSFWELDAASEDFTLAPENVDITEQPATSDTATQTSDAATQTSDAATQTSDAATQVAVTPVTVIVADRGRAPPAPLAASRDFPKALRRSPRVAARAAARHKAAESPKQQLLDRYSNPVSRPEEAVRGQDRWATQTMHRIWADDKWRRQLGSDKQAFRTVAKAWRHVQQAELRKESWVVKLGNRLILKSNAAREETSGGADDCQK
ncbi:uncharacterized protein BROUX77_006425 [Berkeleyomyces rouxiae]|uniref:uncharacterized protein n=1 Tax=Berkeleyomyces rouxiae TaxID=2035830 RepID=UPI003B8106A7